MGENDQIRGSLSCARLFHPVMIAWRSVAIETWAEVDRVDC